MSFHVAALFLALTTGAARDVDEARAIGATASAPQSTSEQTRGDQESARGKEVAAQLRVAFDSGSAPQRITALKASAALPETNVVAQARRGLADRDIDVRLAAFDALGRNAHAQAFDALLEHYRAKQKELRTLERDLPALLTAIARRGDARALAVLGDDVQAQRLAPTVRARILGMARVRSKASVEALMKLADEIGFVDMHNHLEDLRLALLVLSGVDHGRSLQAARDWWRDAKASFVPSERAAELPSADAARWRDFWRDNPTSSSPTER